MKVRARFMLPVAMCLSLSAPALWAQTGLSVYILSGGDAASDQAVAAALSARSHLPTTGAPSNLWDGTQANLEDFDAVVLLNNFNWATNSMPASGQAALLQYAMNGGGVVTGEWLIFNMDAPHEYHKDLEPMTPADNPNSSFGASDFTTYTALTLDATIGAGLPDSFEFALNHISGSETVLVARPEAKVFFSSSIASGAAGLAGWDFGSGRVASFSTFLSAIELSNTNYETLFVNTVEWVAGRTRPCSLKLTATLAGSDWTLGFEVGTAAAANWNFSVLVQADTFRLWSVPLPAIEPPVQFPLPIPNFPALGKIGFLTTLTDSGGIQCSDLVIIDTGTPAAVPAQGRLRELFRR